MELTSEELRYRAERAKQLMDDTLLNEAIAELRSEALEEMASTNLDLALPKVRDLQAMVAACDAIMSKLDEYVTASGVRDGGFKPN